MAESEGGERKGSGVKNTIVAAMMLCASPGLAAAQSTVPAAATETVDPARLATARTITAKLLPDGSYRRMMDGIMQPIMDSMSSSMKALPMKQIAAAAGMSEVEAAKLDKADVARMMTILDPHWEERQRLMMTAMIGAMSDFFTTLEPELREAYATAFAHQFAQSELDDLARFFATPTGEKYAARYLTIAADPAITGMMKSMMPKMMAEMPTFVAAAQKATAGLPPARKPAELTKAERADLARAMGIDPAEFEKSKTSK